jgi:hypothetical protein
MPESALLRLRMGGSDYTYARSASGIPPHGTVSLEYFPNLLLRLVAHHYSYHATHEIHNDHMPPDPSRRIAAGDRAGWLRRLRRLPDRRLQLPERLLLRLPKRILRQLSKKLLVYFQRSPALFAHVLQQSKFL